MVWNFLEKVILIIIGSSLTIIGFLFQSKAQVKNEKEKNHQEKKEKLYLDLLNNIIGFFEGHENEGKKRQFIHDFNTNARLYASNEVMQKLLIFIEIFDEKNKGKKYPDNPYLSLIQAMRKEANKKNTSDKFDFPIKKLN